MRHVHIGAGALGLGLLLPITTRHFEVTVVQRRSERSPALAGALARQGGYRWHATATDGLVHSASVELTGRTPVVDAADVGAWSDLVCDPETVLLTTALGETGLDRFTPQLLRVLRVRAGQRGPRLTVMACENSVGRQFAAMVSRFRGSSVRFVECVVDRMCLRPEVLGGVVHVTSERYGSWAVPEAAASALPAGLAMEPVRDIELARRKKRWLVNTPHFAVGLHARAQGVPYIDDFVRGPGRDLLAQVQEECVRALLAHTDEFPVEELRRFSDLVTARLRSIHMPTALVVRRLRPENAASLAGTARDLLIEPARSILRRGGAAPPALGEALRMLATVVAHGPHNEPMFAQALAGHLPPATTEETPRCS
jgi:mannitol-1-phosphate/altronate dehydrogenase